MEKQERARLLAEARNRAHLTQEEAAERVGVERISIYRWETGKARPYAIHIRRICEVYGVQASEVGLEMTPWKLSGLAKAASRSCVNSRYTGDTGIVAREGNMYAVHRA